MIRLSCAILLMAAFAQAQVVEMIPEAKTMPAPDWVKPGVRLTWHMMSASRQGKSLRAAPHFGADRKDQFGNKYKTNPGGSASGQGYTEIIIVAVEPKLIVWEIRSYLLPGLQNKGPATLTAVSGGTSNTPGTLAGYWMNPVALRNLLAKPAGSHGFLVGALKHDVNGEKRDAVAVAMRDAKSHFRWVYDLNSGVLLSQGHSQTGTKGLRATDADGTSYTGKTWGATATSFREFTQLKLPWLGTPIPDWVAGVKAIDFDGGYKMIVAGSEGVAPLPMAQRFEPVTVRKNWALMRRTMVSGPRNFLDGGTFRGVPITPIKGPYVCGAGSPSGLWIPPAVLQRLTKGQEICASPITEFRATVFFVGPDRGQDVCVIRWENRLQTMDFVHDRKSGGLLRVSTHDRVLSTNRWYTFAGSR